MLELSNNYIQECISQKKKDQFSNQISVYEKKVWDTKYPPGK